MPVFFIHNQNWNESLNIEFDNYQLQNGLNVILHHDSRVPIVTVNIWYHVGSKNELPGKTGFAHLFEHMMFQGSAHVPADKHFQYIQSVGGTLNGSTFFDRTNYFETVPSHHLETALWLEADRMGYFLPALTQQKLDTQLEVVKNERRQRYENQPYGLWLEKILEMSFDEDFSYHWPVIGYMKDLDTANIEDVQNFFKTWYAPSNASLVIAGDYDPSTIKKLVEQYFGQLGSSPSPRIPDQIFSDYNQGEKRLVLKDNVQLPRIYMAYHLPPFGEDETYVADLITDVLSSGKRGRLYKSLVYEKQIAQDAQALILPLQNGSLLFVIATPKPEINIEELETAVQEILDKLGKELVSDNDLQRVKNQVEARKLRELQTTNSRADYLNMFAVYFKEPQLINSEIEKYKKITSQHIQDVANKYIKTDNRVVLTYLPQNKENES